MSCEAHGDEDMQHGPAVESSDDSAYDAMERVPCWICEGTGTWSSCGVPCRDCNGNGYVRYERDTQTLELFPLESA